MKCAFCHTMCRMGRRKLRFDTRKNAERKGRPPLLVRISLPQGCQKFGFCPSSRILRCLSWDSDGHLTYFSSIRISLINARARSRNPDPDIRSHVRLEGVHIAYTHIAYTHAWPPVQALTPVMWVALAVKRR